MTDTSALARLRAHLWSFLEGLWYVAPVYIFLDKMAFALSLAAILGVWAADPMKIDLHYKIGISLIALGAAYVAGHAIYKNNEKTKTEAAAAAITPPAPASASQLQPGLRGFLIPANDPTPPNVCDTVDLPPPMKASFPSMKLALIGPAVTAYGPRQKPFALIRIASEDVLSIENAPTGVVLNATLRDESGRLLATITKNVYHSYAPNDYEVTSDQHSVLVLNSKDQIILSVRYLNPKAIKVLGVFNVVGRPPVTIEEGKILLGKNQLPAPCSINNAPEGAWNQLEAAYIIQ